MATHGADDRSIHNFYDYLIEGYFAIALAVNFFVEFKLDDQPLPVRDLSKIASRYVQGQFLIHFFPIIPFHMIRSLNG
jgi:hypothetical protein